MSQGNDTPIGYAEAAKDRASELRNDLADGYLGRSGGAKVAMIEQLTAAGLSEGMAEILTADFDAQLKTIDASAEALANAYDRLLDIAETMDGKIRKYLPGFRFADWTV